MLAAQPHLTLARPHDLLQLPVKGCLWIPPRTHANRLHHHDSSRFDRSRWGYVQETESVVVQQLGECPESLLGPQEAPTAICSAVVSWRSPLPQPAPC